MQIGFALPSTTDGDELCRFARRAEELGYESVWTGDHVVLPTAPTDQYPYTEDGSFTRPSDAPFMETLTVLTYNTAFRGLDFSYAATLGILALAISVMLVLGYFRLVARLQDERGGQ